MSARDLFDNVISAWLAMYLFFIICMAIAYTIVGANEMGECGVRTRWFYVGGFAQEYPCRFGRWLSQDVR